MPTAISIDNFIYYANYFNNLRKANLNFEIQSTQKYLTANNGTTYSQLAFYATFKGVKSIRGLADIWCATPTPIGLDSVENFVGYADIQKNVNCTKINGDLYRK